MQSLSHNNEVRTVLTMTDVGNMTQGRGFQITKCSPPGILPLLFVFSVSAVCQQQQNVDEVAAPCLPSRVGRIYPGRLTESQLLSKADWISHMLAHEFHYV